jgi:hypothetical protein
MTKTEVTFENAAEVLESVLTGSTRHAIIDELSSLTDYREALSRLRTAMRTNTFKFGTSSLSLDRAIKALDTRTRQDGFHALNDWDGKADRLNEDIIPVDLVNYFLPVTTRPPYPTIGFAIFLDYYFIYVLGMLSLRAWDAADPNAALDQVTRLLQSLQSPYGSGQRFADDAETLILIATSHFEPDNSAYSRLLEKVRTLGPANRLRIAFAHAAILGSHLRYGFEPFYKRDIALMRADNVPDYPWLFFSLITLMRAYAQMYDNGTQGDQRHKVVEGILTALTPDTRAFLGKAPAALAGFGTEVSEFRSLFHRYRDDLVLEFEEHRPSNQEYSPIAFNFNFPHNILKAIVVNAVARGEASFITFNDLLTGFPRNFEGTRAKYAVMTRLLEYARVSPETIRGRSFPMVVYDPLLALRNYTKAINLIKELSSSAA